jgi:hypothetical protein
LHFYYQLAAIDGPVPAALAKWVNEGNYLHMGGIQTSMPGIQQVGVGMSANEEIMTNFLSDLNLGLS